MKIVLLGYMGSGKSTVARLLGEKLNLQAMDLDTLIESEAGQSIPEIFKEKGEIYFRKMEHQVLKAILESDGPFVLALGGGTPCYSGNMTLILQATTQVFYLKIGIPALVERLSSEKEDRPLISHLPDEELPEFIGKHLFERQPFYMQAPHIIKSDNKSVQEIAKEITGILI
ncbi:shikimate kinase [Lentiprolixibacter aurantiacus]|uniref:Shikimate kinase n=1 Tax=Lentiprolixibacter aurantiacus TaxID=2993939 RepID=A0AAE3SP01_9FLAO|nr:shikimate kinase [Lentiprolixibacter aurantiacus]MCX2720090.1 shikimate kinase [Lentiprolixibacter aurantiacus]